MRNKIVLLSYLTGPLLLWLILTEKNGSGLFILCMIFLILYVILSVILIAFRNIMVDGEERIPSHFIRFTFKKVFHNNQTYFIYKESGYEIVSLYRWDGFFLLRIQKYSTFKTFLDNGKKDIDSYVKKYTSVDTYQGFDGFLSNEERIAKNRDKKLNKLLK